MPGILDGDPGAALAGWEAPAGVDSGSATNAGLAFSPADHVGSISAAVPFLPQYDNAVQCTWHCQ